MKLDRDRRPLAAQQPPHPAKDVGLRAFNVELDELERIPGEVRIERGRTDL